MAQTLALKILMKKKRKQGLSHDISEDELRNQVMREMNSGGNQKMDKIIQNLKKYREEFSSNRVPAYLRSKEELEQNKLSHRESKRKSSKPVNLKLSPRRKLA